MIIVSNAMDLSRDCVHHAILPLIYTGGHVWTTVLSNSIPLIRKEDVGLVCHYVRYVHNHKLVSLAHLHFYYCRIQHAPRNALGELTAMVLIVCLVSGLVCNVKKFLFVPVVLKDITEN